MARQTIDFGIDLGTTNSEIAFREGGRAEMVPNNEENQEYTPSAFWIDKDGAYRVGRRAKDAETRESETHDVYLQFKRRMGEAHLFKFARAGKSMRPEELSAEVLKRLLDNARQRIDDVDAAVITVPAAFELPQCEATKRAARLAGMKQSPLLQEPVAAAMAYGFEREPEKATWLVFDFGGGTFDAALIGVKNGFIQVLNHGGDNLLGGGDFDKELVKRYILPSIEDNYHFTQLQFGNDRWKAKLAKLKYNIEFAKICLSQSTCETISIQDDWNWHDEDGQTVELDLKLTQDQVAAVAEPYILRAVTIARQVLAEKHVRVGSIDKVILVGGPTLAPYFREILSDPVAGLGIPLDYSVNPITVVAKGAALFAGTQSLERGSSRGRSLEAGIAEGKFIIEFVDYKSTGPDLEPTVGGRVTAPSTQSLQGFTVEFSNSAARPPWIGGRIPLEKSGVFMTKLMASKGSENVFKIQVHDPHGKPVPIEPTEISYTPGMVSTDVPLIHDIRFETRDGKANVIIQKGTAIPAKVHFSARQAVPVRKGRKEERIQISIVEGPSARANRNSIIGFLEKSGEDLNRDLPAGSELDVTLEIDASRIMTINVYVPMLDQEFQAQYNPDEYGRKALDSEHLQEDLRDTEHRLDQLRDKAAKTTEAEAWQALDIIESEELVEKAESALEEATADKEMARQGMQRLNDLRKALDDVEDKLAWPSLLAESTEAYRYAEKAVADMGSPDQRQTIAALRRELDAAIAEKDANTVRQKIDQLYGLGFAVSSKHIEFWEEWYDYLKKQTAKMLDQAAASLWIRQGDRALYTKDIEPLSKACLQLHALLPAEEQEKAEHFKSTIQ